jgi:phosphate transport system substrate-binding protein
MRYLATIAILPLLLSSCGSAPEAATPSKPVSLKGAGATAPNIVYSRWLDAFQREEPGIHLQYALTGSGDGIRELESGTVDFAGSDIPLTDEQMKKTPFRVLHFPTLVSAIVPVYNLSSVGTQLRFTADTLAGIFAGRIKTWNDPAIAGDNPSANLQPVGITVVHRSDASGSSYAFTDFLSRASESWKNAIGTGAAVSWPTGRPAESSDAICAIVKQTPGAIGYVELNYAEAQKLPYGAVKNSAGKFQTPSLTALGAAIDSAPNLAKDYRASIANPPKADAYPIATLTWLLVPREFKDPAKAKAMKTFLRWVYSDGQKIASPTDYGTLPAEVLNSVRAQVEDIRGTS